MGLRLLNNKVKMYFLVLVGFLSFIAFNLYYVKPVRNFLLKPVLPNTWRFVDTADILRMKNIKYPPNVTDITNCLKTVKSGISIKHVDQNRMIKYKNANLDNPFFKDGVYTGFLPTITWKERVETVYLYMVFADAMKKIGAEFFFTGGSLLGLLRHGGPIPWDTDIDLAVNGTHWKNVRESLSCIEGFRLRTKWHMHWKFHFKERFFPFIDIFFFSENKRYVYAMNYYTLHSILYEKKDVIPLRTALYEGMMVPVPNNFENCVRVEFDAEYCYPPSTNHKTRKHYKKTIVRCSSMSKFYPIQNLKF